MTSINTNKMGVHEKKEDMHCNIPRVRLLGTLSDWKRLRTKITYFDRYGCHKWLDVLLPVINKFIAAIEVDEVDKEFWNGIYDTLPQNQTATNKVHGWICNFFPYTADPVKQQFTGGGGIKQMFRERGKDYKRFMMDENDFFRGVTASAISINKKDYTLAAGFMGVEFENQIQDPEHPEDFL